MTISSTQLSHHRCNTGSTKGLKCLRFHSRSTGKKEVCDLIDSEVGASMGMALLSSLGFMVNSAHMGVQISCSDLITIFQQRCECKQRA